MSCCPECNSPTFAHKRFCEVCEHDLGAPNIRTAKQEHHELVQRCNHADKTIKAMSVESESANFVYEVNNNSRAVIQRPIEIVFNIITKENWPYQSFHKAVDSNVINPQENYWDSVRQRVDAALFPYYFSEIIFASLTLNGRGDRNYGDFGIVLKNQAIKERASLLIENSIKFLKKHNVTITQPNLPKGFRSTWGKRGELANLKYYYLLKKGMKSNDFSKLLLTPYQGTQELDFLEVHIFGDIKKEAVEEISIPTEIELKKNENIKLKMLMTKAKKHKINVSSV